MFSFLAQPYPARDPRFSKAILQALLSGFLIAFILIVFQPFGSYNWQHPYKNVILGGFGLVAVVVNLTDFIVTQRLFKTHFSENRWTVWKEILRNMAGFVLAGFFCVVYGYFAGLMPFSLMQVTYMVAVCFMVGAFPATILILLNYAYLSHKYSAPFQPAPQTQPTIVTPSEDTLTLTAENEKDTLTIAADSLLYIAASDNYCTVFHMENEKLHKTLLRSSLSRLESQINYSRIVRCHRSYLVNLDKVTSISGNAQGYKLYFDVAVEPVPVSRSYNSVVKEQMLVC
ncbi:LytR/AlgR family response regulator transcription factor [Pontibacter fetidus]|uniref:LytTR family transcriptional regulator n=1 Tax=Pontibacter fetidus TaxID=2700082 RepID=A0A6B2H7I1_9BACT|nr:LytTR family DNA-binding domain-containing protein [Pontibacter fetidus]NDK56876.1 LytTR family transcriptional regulator [Pontibacter fetidus]